MRLLFSMIPTEGVDDKKLKGPADEMLEIWFPLKSRKRDDDGDEKLKALQRIVLNVLLLSWM